MFKRRLAVLGAVAVLAITGLAGSAMADETPAAPGAKVTCKTADGKTITLPEIGGKVATGDGKAKLIQPDDKLKIDRVPGSEALPPDVVKAKPLPDGELPPDVVKAKPLPNGELPQGVKIERLRDGVKVEALPDGKLPEGVEAAPARPAEPGDEAFELARPRAGAPEGAGKVLLICEKAG
ncbi:hypothetical protein [Nonomuraea sp. NPDC050786]|uniref:hypothetical protein n=1 Tax=Nonomuraea sp. NPDC050786 TaxID=3154840 RepID=UPI0033F6A252